MIMFSLLLALALTACATADHHTQDDHATIEQFPHQVSLEYEGIPWCGGAIIGSKYILTAAHCLQEATFDISSFKVRVGSNIRQEGGVLHDVDHADIFGDYVAFKRDADVGVIVLKTPIAYGPTARPVSLVSPGVEPAHAEMLTVVGWNFNRYCNAAKASTGLQVLRQPYIGRDICNFQFLKHFDVRLTENMLCVLRGKPATDNSYAGTYGDALINSENKVVGLLSWKTDDIPTGRLTAYTNLAVPEINEFVQKYINKDNLQQ